MAPQRGRTVQSANTPIVSGTSVRATQSFVASAGATSNAVVDIATHPSGEGCRAPVALAAQ